MKPRNISSSGAWDERGNAKPSDAIGNSSRLRIGYKMVVRTSCVGGTLFITILVSMGMITDVIGEIFRSFILSLLENG